MTEQDLGTEEDWHDNYPADPSPASASSGETSADETAGDEATPLVYDSLDDFVREVICQVFRRTVGPRASFRWASDWWNYPEAWVRLEAIWRAWEHLHHDPNLGVSVWMRDHADYHLAALWTPTTGVFTYSEETNDRNAPLPYAPLPPELA